MAREYATRRSRSHGGPHQFLVITVSFLLGYVAASFFSIETINRWINTQVLAPHETLKAEKKLQSPQTAISHKPKFEFYTLLTNEKTSGQQLAEKPTATIKAPSPSNSARPVFSSEPLTVKPSTSPTQQANNNANNSRGVKSESVSTYLVQAASFKARQDAEQMKGTLILKGFNAYIIPVVHPTKGNWFRVVIGPYKNRGLAQQAQMSLVRNEHLHGMIVPVG